MRRASCLLLGSLLVSACSLPEDSNPAIRCAADLSCPGTLECYRGFCIGDTDGDEPAPTITAEDAGPVVVLADAAVATHVGVDASAASVVVEDDDADVAPIQDLPGSAVTTTTTPAVEQTPAPTVVSNPTPAPSTPAPTPAPAPTTPVATIAPCLSECSAPTSKSCKDCFKTAFGDDPDKLCGSASQFSAAMQSVCSAICAVTPTKGKGSLSCSTELFSCRGPGCGGM